METLIVRGQPGGPPRATARRLAANCLQAAGTMNYFIPIPELGLLKSQRTSRFMRVFA